MYIPCVTPKPDSIGLNKFGVFNWRYVRSPYGTAFPYAHPDNTDRK